MLALAAWSAGTLLSQSDVTALGARFGPRTPARGLAVWIWVVVAGNAAAWLARILPAVGRSGPPAYLRGTGLPSVWCTRRTWPSGCRCWQSPRPGCGGGAPGAG